MELSRDLTQALAGNGLGVRADRHCLISHRGLLEAILKTETPTTDRNDVAAGEHTGLREGLIVEQRAARIGLAQILHPHLRISVRTELGLLLGDLRHADLDVARLRVPEQPHTSGAQR